MCLRYCERVVARVLERESSLHGASLFGRALPSKRVAVGGANGSFEVGGHPNAQPTRRATAPAVDGLATQSASVQQ